MRVLQELDAQAVAVRSYVMSTYGSLQGYFGYADICDNGCQAYPGIANENPVTDAAVSSTADTVVLMPNGTVARTQYSSSTGGYSAGGTFAAVPDLGDSVCVPGACNPHHTWQAQVPVTAIDAAYPQIGTLVSVGVSQRSNLGDLGGRVLQMTLQGSAQSVTISGDTFASQFAQYGLQSNWFSVTSQASGGVGGYWLVATDGGVFSFGNAVFHGSAGNIKLAKPVVGMASTPDGGGYWLVASDGGRLLLRRRRLPRVGRKHQARQAGGGHGVDPRRRRLLAGGLGRGRLLLRRRRLPRVRPETSSSPSRWWAWRRPPTAAATGWWPRTAGVFSYGDAVFHGSTGALRLAQPVTAMASTPDGGGLLAGGLGRGRLLLRRRAVRGLAPRSRRAFTGCGPAPHRHGGGLPDRDDRRRAVDFGDAPQFGDVADVVVGYSGHLVGGATVSG